MSATCRPTLVSNDRTLAVVTIADGHRIYTTVTHSAVIVAGWINETVQGCTNGGRSFFRCIVGLEVACQPNGNIVLLQFCVGNRCLIYQLLHRGDAHPPREFYEFLVDARFYFVGAGVEVVAYGLQREHGFSPKNVLDLGDVAAKRLSREDLRRAGLERLAKEVMRVEVDTPAEVRRSEWWRRDLSQEQIAYACVDAAASFAIGSMLLC